MNSLWIIILLTAAALMWWLSGFDTHLTNEDRHADLLRRLARCGISMALLLFALICGFLPLQLALIIPLALIWVGPAAEMGARTFHRLVDPEDDREFNPKQLARDLDRLAKLVREGNQEQAIALCTKLRAEGDASSAAMDTMLFQLYGDVYAPDRVPVSPPLAEAQALSGQGKFVEAEMKLQAVLQRDPHQLAAALMLMRLYARDLPQPQKADALLRQ